MGSWSKIVGLAIASALCISGCGEGGGQRDEAGDTDAGTDGSDAGMDEGSDADTGSDGGTGDTADEPGDPFDPPPEPEPLPDETVAEIAGRIDAILADPVVAGTTQSVLVIDEATGQQIYARNPDTALIPASNTKLFTTATGAEVLGADHRFHTRVAASVMPDGAGTIAGDLFLLGDHDLTWSTEFYDSPRFPLDRIADALWDTGVRNVTGNVWAHGEFLYGGARLGTFDPIAHRAAAADNFVGALQARGITTGPPATSPAFEPPGGFVELMAWDSPPLAVGSAPLNTFSHNEFADILNRHLGHALAGDSSYEAGSAEILTWLSSIGTDTSQSAFADGSGLSRGNRVSARNVVDLIVHLATQPEGPDWNRSLSIAGVRGTLGGRMLGADTLGRVWGKTGTLSDVIATSGFALNRHDGRRYVFSVLMNDVPSQSGARSIQDQVVTVVADDHRDGLPRPTPVELKWVRNVDNNLVEFSWTASTDAEGYVLWLSDDGRVWDRDEARFVQSTTHRAAGLAEDAAVFARVTAWAGGFESDPSDVYAAWSSREASTILVVDGNDRYQVAPAPENPVGVGHDFALAYADAIGERRFDVVANEMVALLTVDLAPYDAVIWMLGEESTDDDTLDADEQGAIAQYTAAGGSFMISGSEIGWDLVERGSPEDAMFYRDVLRADFVGDDAGTVLAQGVGGLVAAGSRYGFLIPQSMAVQFPDQLAPAGGSQAFLDYAGGVGGTAAVQYDGEYRLVHLGFPFEAVDGAADRRTLMDAILGFFGI